MYKGGPNFAALRQNVGILKNPFKTYPLPTKGYEAKAVGKGPRAPEPPRKGGGRAGQCLDEAGGPEAPRRPAAHVHIGQNGH